MTVPNWYQLVVLAFAAWRTWHLIAYDNILDGPRHLAAGLPWDWKEGDHVPVSYRERFAEFLTCPYCAGFWGSTAWWGLFQITERWAVVIAVPFAINALVVSVASLLDKHD
jgi:hypothetical protein